MSSVNDNLMNVLASANPTKLELENEHDKGHTFTTLLFGVLVITLLLATISATRIYGDLRSLQESANETRLSASLLANTVRSNDAIGAVAVGNGPEGYSLVLREYLESGTYETRIYLYQGYIVEEYALESSAYAPERATQILASNTFEFSYSAPVLTISCDSGTTYVTLRSLKGGA